MELVLVIAVLGILATAVVVLSPSVTPARLDAAAKEVQAHIEFAQHHAMMTTQTAGVQCVASGAYTVYQGTTVTPLANPLTKQNMVLTLSDKYPGISISSHYTVEFNKFGSPITGGGGSVTITDGSSSKTISVTANTGRVSIP